MRRRLSKEQYDYYIELTGNQPRGRDNEGGVFRPVVDDESIYDKIYEKFPKRKAGRPKSAKKSKSNKKDKEEKPIAGGYKKSDGILDLTEYKSFFLTSAQNNTYVHKEFLAAAENWCKENNGKLIVGTYSYNRNAYRSYEKGDKTLWYDNAIKPYIIDEQAKLADGFIWAGELNILPTAENPASGMESYSGSASMAIPHAKQQILPVATQKNKRAKHIISTGSITLKNYIQKKAGQKAEHHHIFGGFIIDVAEDGGYVIRNVNAKSSDGHFYDLDKKYTKDGVEYDQKADAITLPDLHSQIMKADRFEALVNYVDFMNPKDVFLHDLHDHNKRNHHSIKDPYFMFKMWANETECVRSEIMESVKVIDALSDYVRGMIYVVESNHDKALERWLKENSYEDDPVNSIFFLELELMNYKQMYYEKKSPTTFLNACTIVDPMLDLVNVKFLKKDESIIIHGIEMSEHGDTGANGAKGSVKSYSKSHTKMNVAHNHSTMMLNGIYQVGTVLNTSDAGYTKGMSSWSMSTISVYENGKRQMIIFDGLNFKH